MSPSVSSFILPQFPYVKGGAALVSKLIDKSAAAKRSKALSLASSKFRLKSCVCARTSSLF